MSDIDLKAALHEQARITRKAGEALKINAEAMLSSAQALVLIAGALEGQAGGDTPASSEPPSTAREPFVATPAPAAPKATRQRKATDPTPAAQPTAPAATIEQAQAKIRELVAAKGGDQAKAVLARNGVTRVSEAKPEHFAKIISDANEAIAGKDFNASSDASPFD